MASIAFICAGGEGPKHKFTQKRITAARASLLSLFPPCHSARYLSFPHSKIFQRKPKKKIHSR